MVKNYMAGTLFVVSTPIGNFEDLTRRAETTLRQVDFVVAENLERAKKLLAFLGIRKPVLTINTYNEKTRSKEIVRRLKGGESCALISSAGTPCVSDPGGILVSMCHEESIDVKVVPGPSSVTSAVSVSGLSVERFLFYGFLPQRKGKKRKVLEELSKLPYAIVIFESPRRLEETLKLIKEVFGKRRITISKEMTKIHERTIRTDTERILEVLKDIEPIGEFTIVVDKPEK